MPTETTTITKILFRRGTDVIRRQAGGLGVVLNLGEPGVTTDTHRLYVGDGSRVGGYPAGIKNHGCFDVVFGSYNGYDLSTYNSLTAGGIDVGDILFDNSTSVMYYVSSKNVPFNAVPDTSELVRFSLIGRVSAYNGLSADKVNEYAQFGLDPNVFTVNGTNFTVYNNTTIGTALIPRSQTVFGGFTVTSNANIQGNLALSGNGTFKGLLSSATVVYAGAEVAGRNSNNWFSNWQTVNSVSAQWSSVYTFVNTLTPFPMVWSGSSPTFVVGINVTNPTIVGLTVKGTSTTATALSVIGAIEATGDITAFSTSDINLKQNIAVIENALEKIDAIRGVTFAWNCEYKKGNDVGVIAQEVESIVPEAVITRADGYKAVDYHRLIPLLIQAIKELKSKI